MRAKSEISLEDVKELVEFGVELFHASQNKLYVQVCAVIVVVMYMLADRNMRFVLVIHRFAIV